MSSHKQTYSRITPLNPRALRPTQRRELAGERPWEEQAAYLDRSQVDVAEPLTDTTIYEGEFEASDVQEALDTVNLTDSSAVELLADVAADAQPISVQAELPAIEGQEGLADIYLGQLPVSAEEGLVRETESPDLLTALELRAGETADPLLVADEGAAYVPPLDPPAIPGCAGSLANAEIASGLGVSPSTSPMTSRTMAASGRLTTRSTHACARRCAPIAAPHSMPTASRLRAATAWSSCVARWTT
jgi:hypothetical protein